MSSWKYSFVDFRYILALSNNSMIDGCLSTTFSYIVDGKFSISFKFGCFRVIQAPEYSSLPDTLLQLVTFHHTLYNVQCDRKKVIQLFFLLNAFIIGIFLIGKQLNTRE